MFVRGLGGGGIKEQWGFPADFYGRGRSLNHSEAVKWNFASIPKTWNPPPPPRSKTALWAFQWRTQYFPGVGEGGGTSRGAKPIFTVRKQSLRRLCFYTCLLFCSRGRSGPVHAGIPPPKQTPPREQTPPPGTDGYCCGRYAFYWNAFLLSIFSPDNHMAGKIRISVQ